MLIDVVVPALGESISEVEIGEWRKQEGATVKRDDTLVALETDKATVEIPAPESGTLSKILKPSGATAAVGDVIARIEAGKVKQASSGREETREAEPARPQPENTQTSAGTPDDERQREAEKEAEATSESAAAASPSDEKTRASSPATDRRGETRTADEEVPQRDAGITEEEHRTNGEATGQFAEQPPASKSVDRQAQSSDQTDGLPGAHNLIEPAAENGRQEEIVPMTALRRRIAQRLVQAQQNAALLTTFNEIEMSQVAEMRQQYGKSFEQKYNVKLGLMSFFVKAVVASLKASPEINGEIRGEQIVYRNYYDIGIAVGGGRGLVVPVLRGAERKSFADIEKAIADFARRARVGELTPDDLAGGTFTITNGGIYGSLLSTPIVNPPQSAILGMHAIQERPVARNGAVVIRPMMYIALTYDHRLVDGREAVSFLKNVKELVEEPTRLLFEI
jgi:2-oxoglutarate dehydrogenase E2 component (dihydrolipoamide succinyltransferase)